MGLIDDDDCSVKPDVFGTLSKSGSPDSDTSAIDYPRFRADRNIATTLMRLEKAESQTEFEAYENQVMGLLRGFIVAEVLTEKEAARYREAAFRYRTQKADLFTP